MVYDFGFLAVHLNLSKIYRQKQEVFWMEFFKK